MAEELGKIEKPSVESFSGSRKLIVAPLLFSGKDAPEDFMTIFNRCWDQTKEQLANLESKLGGVTLIYHEMLFESGEKGLSILEQLNPHSFQFVKAKTENGARIEVIEEIDIATENMDWERCLMVAMGPVARNKLSELYMASSTKRFELIARKIDESLKEGEIGLLITREGHRTQFPQSIEVFNIYPPALDELNRWLREYTEKNKPAPPGS